MRIPDGLDPPSVRIDRFGRKFLTHGKGEWSGQPFVLEDWQLTQVIQPIFDDVKRTGNRLVRRITEALVGVAKKNGKTSSSAALGLYGLYADGYYTRDGPKAPWRWQREYGAEVYNVAGSKEQARILFDSGRGMIQRNPLLLSQSKVYRDAIEHKETGSVWRVLAADPKLAHGPSPSLAVIDELWVHRDPELYEAFASAGAARVQPLLLTITTAGWDRDSIAYRMYLRGRKRERGFYYRWWEAPAGADLDDREAWRAANPSSWVTDDYLEGELRRARALGNEAQFRRWHLNQWTSGQEAALPAHVVDKGSKKPHIPEGSTVVVGVDTAPKRDSTAVAIVRRDDEGVHHVRVILMRADPDTGYLDYAALEDLLRELCRRFEVERILVDPYNMLRSMIMLVDEGLPIEEFPQGDARMVPASMNLYELLNEGRMRHGNAQVFREQAANTSRRVSERGWRFQKLKSSGVIDSVVAVAMASHVLEQGADEDDTPVPFLLV